MGDETIKIGGADTPEQVLQGHLRGQPSPYSENPGRPDVPADESRLSGEQRDRIAGLAVVFVNTLHTGQNVADHLLLLIEAVEQVGMLDLSKPAGGVGGEYLAELERRASRQPIVIHHSGGETPTAEEAQRLAEHHAEETKGYDIKVDRDGKVGKMGNHDPRAVAKGTFPDHVRTCGCAVYGDGSTVPCRTHDTGVGSGYVPLDGFGAQHVRNKRGWDGGDGTT